MLFLERDNTTWFAARDVEASCTRRHHIAAFDCLGGHHITAFDMDMDMDPDRHRRTDVYNEYYIVVFERAF